MSNIIPIVFVVDDVMFRCARSLELMISSAGWKPEIFASAKGVPLPPTGTGSQLPRARCPSSDLNGSRSSKRASLGDRIDMPIIFITGVAGDVPMRTGRPMKAGAVEF